MYLAWFGHLVATGSTERAALCGGPVLRKSNGWSKDEATVDAHIHTVHGEQSEGRHGFLHVVVGWQEVTVGAELAE